MRKELIQTMWRQPGRGGGGWAPNINNQQYKMAAAANWANLPLPPGWQAVWDQTQNRYFFIDHSTKTTSWIDPREALWKQQNMPVQSSAQYSGYTQHAGRAQPVAQAHEMIPMADRQTHKQHWTHDLTPGTGSSRHSSREDVAIEETMFVQDNSETNRHLPPGDVAGSRRSSSSGHKLTLMKLRADFPDTEGELISDLLESNHGNERETRTVLMELGYKHHTATPSCTQSPRRGSATKTMSPSRVQSVPAPVQLATWEKNNMKRKLQQEFQSVSQTVVEMALEVSMYDEAKARAVLHSQSRQSASTGGDANNMASQSRRSSTQQVDRRDVSHSRSATPSYGSATPLYGSGLIETSVHISESTHSRSPTPVGAPSSSNSGSVTPRGASTTPQVVSPARYTKRPTPKVSVTTSRPAPKSTVTTSRPAPKSSVTTSRPAPKSSVTTSRPERTEIRKKSPAIKKQPDYVSPNRTLAKGPDASLVIGPQIQNLIADYGFALGPDRNNVKGPDPRDCVGPCARQRTRDLLARGPDPSLRHGPHG